MVKYPRIVKINFKQNNTGAKCECGVKAFYKSTVERSYVKGDTEQVWRCDRHKFSVDVNGI